jgi:hypothetical protein
MGIAKPVKRKALDSVQTFHSAARILSSLLSLSLSTSCKYSTKNTYSSSFVSVYITRFIHKQFYYTHQPLRSLSARTKAHVTRVPTYPQIHQNLEHIMMAVVPPQQIYGEYNRCVAFWTGFTFRIWELHTSPSISVRIETQWIQTCKLWRDRSVIGSKFPVLQCCLIKLHYGQRTWLISSRNTYEV